MFSKACEYGIKASIYIVRKSMNGERASLKEVAKAIDSPLAFTAKILQALAKHGVIQSSHGPTGGYDVGPETIGTITLLQIVKAIDGDAIYVGCGLGLEECNASKPCPLHYQFIEIRQELKHMLESTTLEQLARGIRDGSFVLKR